MISRVVAGGKDNGKFEVGGSIVQHPAACGSHPHDITTSLPSHLLNARAPDFPLHTSFKMARDLTPLSEDPEWADITPIPQVEGSTHPLAAIAYEDSYSEAMDYLRAVMAANEMSDRVLTLTDRIISMNPAHYTIWLYRARTLQHLKKDLKEELEWLNPTALRHQKNYQIWHHRQMVVEGLGTAEGEPDFLKQMFVKDSKNYHVWSYRQWLVKRFNLWEGEARDREIKDIEELLEQDVRNNSAWNHRWFVIFGKSADSFNENQTVDKEIK